MRPSTLNEVIGQTEVMDRLKILIYAAKKNNNALRHILLDGPPGVGKTTIAMVLASEMGSRCHVINGATVRRVGDIVVAVNSIQKNDILFIDEVHRIPKQVEEAMYPLLEDFKLDLFNKDRTEAVSIKVPKFTLVGATTLSGNLSKPFRDRFSFKQRLRLYSNDELGRILSALLLKTYRVDITDLAAEIIAKASRGTPRIAIDLAHWVHDYNLQNGSSEITSIDAGVGLQKLGVSPDGYTDVDQQYLETLRKLGMNSEGGYDRVGLQTLSSASGIDMETILNVIEPFLLYRGKITIGTGGRRLI